jgi:hypothetical protein
MVGQAYVDSGRNYIYFHESPTYAKSRQWPNFFVYVYLASILALIIGSFFTLIGAVNLTVRVFLNIMGILVPSTTLFGFVATLKWVRGERLYPATAIQVWIWVVSAASSCVWIGMASLIHVILHGNRNTFQPLASFPDTGTTYLFAYIAAFGTSCCNFYLALGVIYGYCNNLYFPSEITLSTPPVSSEDEAAVLKIKDA